MHRFLLVGFFASLLGAGTLPGCKNAEKECNTARVAAHDAWQSVRSATDALCQAPNATPSWAAVREELKRQAFHARIFGAPQSEYQLRNDVDAVVGRAMTSASIFCRVLTEATEMSTASAVSARDSAAAVRPAMDDLRSAADEVAAVSRNFSGAPLREGEARDHSFGGIVADMLETAYHAPMAAALSAASAANGVARAEAASRTSFEKCHELHP